MSRASAGWVSWRLLTLLQLREQPLRTLVTLLAIALGVALGSAVYLINTDALQEFDQATRRVVGTADEIVRAPASGFAEALFVRLMHVPAIAAASPMLDLTVALALPPDDPAHPPLGGTSLHVLGVDPFRAADLEPALMAALGGQITQLFAPDAIVLSDAAAQALHLQRGATLPVRVGTRVQRLRVIDVLPADAYPEALGLMDIASAQWTLGYLGRLNRIDLRLQSGADVTAFRAQLAALLPPGAVALTPRVENGRAANATRAYRVNLNMLALVALFTGAFLVFATQSLTVLRRRVTLGLLRALGVTRAELQRALLGEALTLGVLGSLLGLVGGVLMATLVPDYLGTNLGNRQLAVLRSALGVHPMGLLALALIGTGAALAGAWIPAHEAATRPPAAALKAGDVEPLLQRLPTARPGLALVIAGALLAWLPPLWGLPLGGYLSVGCLLLGAIVLVPQLLQAVLHRLPGSGRAVVLQTTLAQLRGTAGSSAVSLAAVIVSFSLMVAMAIMVHSFRQSFQVWLVRLLPADLQLRLPPGSDSAALSEQAQQRIAQLPGILRADFQRTRQLYLRADRPAITLIARHIDVHDPAQQLPLVQRASRPAPAGAPQAWISEALQDQYGLSPGQWLQLPLGSHPQRFYIAGTWRDYVRPGGAVAIDRSTYIHATGDTSATEASLWQRPGRDSRQTEAAIYRVLGGSGGLELLSGSELRDRSLQIFDQAFLVTYALEAVAVIIGLTGISVAASAAALARRGQFGMLRHLGVLRGQILGMLACEGLLQSTLAVLYGLLVGAALSLILVYVINRQSFHWSIDFAVPWMQLLILSVTLIAAAALTALWSGRAAMSQDVIRAVREDW
jgi:putative ABC transport system permease protein